jgi:hypothetical protein
MWNKNRWNPYSSNVHTKLPKKKHRAVLRYALAGRERTKPRGRYGLTLKDARGTPPNCRRERKAMYVAIGNQIAGTTHHLVLVSI